MNKTEAFKHLEAIHQVLEGKHEVELAELCEQVINGYFYESPVKPNNVLKEALKLLKSPPKNDTELNNIKYDREAWLYCFQVIDNKAIFSSGLCFISFPTEGLEDGWYTKALVPVDQKICADWQNARTYCRNFENFYNNDYNGMYATAETFLGRVNKSKESNAVSVTVHDKEEVFNFDTKVLVIFQQILLKYAEKAEVVHLRYDERYGSSCEFRFKTFAFKNLEIELVCVHKNIGAV